MSNNQIQVEIKGFNNLITKLNQYPAISEQFVNRAINRSLVRILGEEKQQAPVHTGNLRDNWKLDFGRFQGTLSSNAPYSMAVHFGTSPHAVPASALTAWAAKKGLNPWAVAKSIAKKGTKANPFLQKAVDLQRENINREFKDALDSINNELSK